MTLTTQQFLNTSLLPCSATCCWWRSSVHLNSTCTSLVGFPVSTASVLAEQLLPEVNQSSPTLGVEEIFSLCCTRTVFSEKWNTTNRVCFAPATYCKSICPFFFFQAYVYFSEYHNGTGLGGSACACRVKNDFVCATGWCLCESLIPEVHSLCTRYSHRPLSAAAQAILTARAAVQKADLDCHAHLSQFNSLQGSFFCVKFYDCTIVADS